MKDKEMAEQFADNINKSAIDSKAEETPYGKKLLWQL